MNRKKSPPYQQTSFPVEVYDGITEVSSLLLSLHETKGIPWKTGYEHVIRVSGKLGEMPQEKKVADTLLKELGFFPQSIKFSDRELDEIFEDLDSELGPDAVVIIRLSDWFVGTVYVPVMPTRDSGEVKFRFRFPEDYTSHPGDTVWISWADGLDHSPSPRRKVNRQKTVRQTNATDNEALFVYNENPTDNLIGDCAVRAVAGLFDVSWEEAVRKLAQAMDYRCTTVNRTDNIDALMKKEGFDEFAGIKRNGRYLTGREFCALIHDMFPAGTGIFAYVGSSHVVSIRVLDGEYKIVDTWDSTNRKIVRYWAKYPKKPQRRVEPPAPAPQVKTARTENGARIRHSIYGVGKIIKKAGSTVTIRFDNGAEKVFTAKWVEENCSPAE